MTRLRIAAVIFAMAAVATGCLDDSITGERPISIDLDITPESPMVDENVRAVFSATGTGLRGVLVDWGDGVVDSLALSGLVVEAQSYMDHIYTTAGEYPVTARVEDQTSSQSATTTVVVR
ncbi:PKD domain-containing protein [Gaopeijia maritima]|uniref:PKD domain-containing protein n=1 Tax=Gaopeijia maritima TaxID=3119007 RepID=A0ABU9E8P9_9BACT